MFHLDIENYSNIIFDFDGVVMDTNSVKYENIKKSVKKYCDKVKAKEVIEYFTTNSGIPREIKINRFFDQKTSTLILEDYNLLNSQTLSKVPLTEGFRTFLTLINSYKINVFILSGGDQKEIEALLRQKGIIEKFDLIMSGPKTKQENLNIHKTREKSLYIGDSKVDYEIAKQFNFDFIFVYEYSQFYQWKEFFKDKEEVLIIKNIASLMKKNH